MAGQIAEAYVQIIPTTDGIASGISKSLGGEGATSGKSFGKSFLSMASKVITVAAIAKVAKAALEAGGAVQQSFGGLETIYGDAAEGAKQYAREAAAAGISMNSYAEQAVSFGAALKQAYGGDTTRAMEAANTALLDMADNSAKMGTDMSAIQSAYQGFAKQNYTMLDNLKLGYGGTKTEMERLLKDAQAITGIEYNIDNLGDVYDAIHVIQGELGLTGVAAEEAKTTFTGSFQAMKASATNLLADIVLGNDLTSSLNSLTTNITNFIGNAAPMITSFAAQAPKALVEIAKAIVPVLWEAGKAMISSLISVIVEALPQLEIAARMLWYKIVIAFNEIKGNIISNIKTAISNAVAAVKSFVGQMLSAGANLIQSVANGIASAVGSVISKVRELGNKILTAIRSFVSQMVSAGRNLLMGVAEGIGNAVASVVAKAKEAASKVVGAVKSFLGIASPSKLMRDEVGEMMMLGLAEGIEENTSPVTNALDEISEMAVSSIDSNLGVNAALGVDADATATGELAQLISIVSALSAKVENLRVYLDGDRLVGGITGRMDNALGSRTLMVERGLA